MKRHVTLTIVQRGFIDITVDSETDDEAKAMALDIAPGFPDEAIEWWDADFVVNDIEEVRG